MKQRFQFKLQQVFHDLSAGLLLRPALMTVSGAMLAFGLTFLEERSGFWSDAGRWFFPGEVGSAQVVLGTIAGSMMTVIAVVYSILLVALSLASMQFSPRILGGFMKDPTNQYTFGLFLGTFTYCLLVLRTVHGEPDAFVPALSVAIAIVLALCCLSALIFFIHHIARGIQANFIVDRIAEDTIEVINERFPEPYKPNLPEKPPAPPEDAKEVHATYAGYIQLVDEERMYKVAQEHKATIWMKITAGEFVIEGSTLAQVSPPEALTQDLRDAIEGAFDSGETRTLQQDLEFGIRQIVDIALKAISPAINDPSTAVTCIDQLSRVLSHLAKRHISSPVLREATGEPRLILRRPTFQSALDLALNQIRQYGKSDLAVSLRMLRSLTQIAQTTRDIEQRQRLWYHGQMIDNALTNTFQPEELQEFDNRTEALKKLCGEDEKNSDAPGPSA